MREQPPDGPARQTPCPEASLAAAIYPDKQAWKEESGNRYTPEELRAMDRHWDIQITNPDQPHGCPAD